MSAHLLHRPGLEPHVAYCPERFHRRLSGHDYEARAKVRVLPLYTLQVVAMSQVGGEVGVESKENRHSTLHKAPVASIVTRCWLAACSGLDGKMAGRSRRPGCCLVGEVYN